MRNSVNHTEGSYIKNEPVYLMSKMGSITTFLWRDGKPYNGKDTDLIKEIKTKAISRIEDMCRVGVKPSEVSIKLPSSKDKNRRLISYISCWWGSSLHTFEISVPNDGRWLNV